MAECLVCKLKEEYPDNSLLKLGEMRLILMRKDATFQQSTITGSTKFAEGNLKLSENSSGSPLVASTNKDTFYFSGEAGDTMLINNKYSMTRYDSDRWALPINEAPFIKQCRIAKGWFYGDMKYIEELDVTPTSSVKLAEGRCYGEITEMGYAKLASISTFQMYEGNLNINKFANANSLTFIVTSDKTKVSGQPSLLANIATLKTLAISGVSGAVVEWSSESLRNASYPVVTFTFNTKFASSADLDRYLINMAKCTVPDNNYYNGKAIRVLTSRTSASNDAIKTLLSKGIQVYIDNKLQTGNE